MKKWMNVILVMVMAMICSMTMALPAFAAENPGVSIPVTVSLTGTQPSAAENFTVVLKADDASYPMPEGAEDGVYIMTITGGGTKNFPTMTYSRVSIYTYTIYQTAGTNKKCTYDKTVYSLTVYVTNAEDGSGLETAAVLYPDAQGDKLSGAAFQNEYEVVKPTPTPETPAIPAASQTPSAPPKTGDEATPILYAVLIAVSLGVIVTLLLIRKSKKEEE